MSTIQTKMGTNAAPPLREFIKLKSTSVRGIRSMVEGDCEVPYRRTIGFNHVSGSSEL